MRIQRCGKLQRLVDEAKTVVEPAGGPAHVGENAGVEGTEQFLSGRARRIEIQQCSRDARFGDRLNDLKTAQRRVCSRIFGAASAFVLGFPDQALSLVREPSPCRRLRELQHHLFVQPDVHGSTKIHCETKARA